MEGQESGTSGHQRSQKEEKKAPGLPDWRSQKIVVASEKDLSGEG